MGKICQSCGMPLGRDPEKGGLELDGSRSTTYCSYCYDAGAFRHPDVPVQEFQAHCVEAMRQGGFPRPIAWLMTRRIPKLDRWTG